MFHCNGCGRSFDTPAELTAHIMTMTCGIPAPEMRDVSPMELDMACQKCKAQYPQVQPCDSLGYCPFLVKTG
jgi:hypothetical protein